MDHSLRESPFVPSLHSCTDGNPIADPPVPPALPREPLVTMTLLILILLYVLLAWLLYVGRPRDVLDRCRPTLGFADLVPGAESTRRSGSPCLLLGFAGGRRRCSPCPAVRRSGDHASRAMPLLAPLFPSMSDTEREALEAGSVWWDAELFSGAPRWKKLLDVPESRLSDREQAFLEGPVRRPLPDAATTGRSCRTRTCRPEIWEYMGETGLLRDHHPDRVRRPGVLGDRELRHRHQALESLVHRGRDRDGARTRSAPPNCCCTTAPRNRRTTTCRASLAARNCPCFALTEPFAGSDAGSMRSGGVVTRGMWTRAKKSSACASTGRSVTSR